MLVFTHSCRLSKVTPHKSTVPLLLSFSPFNTGCAYRSIIALLLESELLWLCASLFVFSIYLFFTNAIFEEEMTMLVFFSAKPNATRSSEFSYFKKNKREREISC